MKHLFIVNPISFPLYTNFNQFTYDVKRYFDTHPNETYTIHKSRYPRDAVSFVRKYAMQTNDFVRVYAVGGDGILFDCLNGVSGLENTQLTSMPFSPPNCFIRTFGEGNYNIFRQIEELAKGHVIPTDTIECSSNNALSFCTIGAESASNMNAIKINDFINRTLKKKFFGDLPFTLAGLIAVFDKKVINQHYTIDVDGECFDGCYTTINISNTHCYSDSFSISKNASPIDGYLDITMVKSANPFKILSIFKDYLYGKSNKYPNLIIQKRAKKIDIKSDSAIYLNLDGETFFDNQISIKVASKSVNFVAPQGLHYIKGGTINE